MTISGCILLCIIIALAAFAVNVAKKKKLAAEQKKQLEQEINAAFRELADSDPSFETIVAFAENCADPHAVPSDKILEEGMSVIVDMGCKFEGYCSDMTRTYFIGKNTMEDVYDTVLRANLAGIAAVKPGVRFCDIDRACRQVIEEAGYGSYVICRLAGKEDVRYAEK